MSNGDGDVGATSKVSRRLNDSNQNLVLLQSIMAGSMGGRCSLSIIGNWK